MPKVYREQALKRLQALHDKYKNQWYGLDNSSDEEIVDAILYGRIDNEDI